MKTMSIKKVLGVNLNRNDYVYYTITDIIGNVIESNKIKINSFNIKDEKYINTIIENQTKEM